MGWFWPWFPGFWAPFGAQSWPLETKSWGAVRKWGTQVVLSYLVGGWPNHLEKYEFVNGMIIPYIMENKIHVPNRQTVIHGYQWQSMVLNGNSWWSKLVSATSSNQTHLPIIQHMIERGCRPVPANTWSSYPNETAVWDTPPIFIRTILRPEKRIGYSWNSHRHSKWQKSPKPFSKIGYIDMAKP